MRDPLAQFRKRPAGSPVGETTDSEGYVAFGAKDRAERLKIRKVVPPTHSPGYNYLLDVAYDGDSGTCLMLVYTFLLVTVKGRNLLPLVMALENSTCDFIQEFDPERWAKPNGTVPFIESIQVEMQQSGPSVADGDKLGKTLH